MAISVLQYAQSSGAGGAGSTTRTVTLSNVQAGSAIVVWVTWSTVLNSGATPSVADPTNGSYTQVSSTLVDTGATQTLACFRFFNSAAVPGSLVITLTLSAANRYPGIIAIEVAGVAASPLDGFNGSLQSPSGPTTTDGLTSGTFSVTGSSAILLGCSLDNFVGGPAATAGTGFTSLGTAWDFNNDVSGVHYARAESRLISSAGTYATTFTGAATNGSMTIGLALDEAGGGAPADPVLARARQSREAPVADRPVRRALSAALLVAVAASDPPPWSRRKLPFERPPEEPRIRRRPAFPESVDQPPAVGYAIFADDARRPLDRPQRARAFLIPVSADADGSGSAALSSFGLSGSGGLTFLGSGGAALASFAAGGTGTVAFTGSGSAALSGFACSGVGAEGFAANGSVSFSNFGASGSGTESFAGSGAAALSPFAVAGNGALGSVFSGSGTVAMSPFAGTGTGAESFTGTGSAALGSFACSGSGTETITGSGSVACQPFGAVGNGALGTVFAGSGSAALSPMAASGSGAEAFTGSGTAARLPFGAAGAGTEQITGSGNAAMPPFGAAGNGAQGTVFVGSGGAALSRFAASGAGLERFDGSGTVALSPVAVVGSGLLGFSGSGSAAPPSFGATSTGFFGSFIGIGAVGLSPFGATGIGTLGAIFLPASRPGRKIAGGTYDPRRRKL